MTFRIEFTKAAFRDFRKLANPVQLQLQSDIQNLADEPRPHGCKKLKGVSNRWRIRSGDYRVIYQIDDGILLVVVLALGHRRDVYD